MERARNDTGAVAITVALMLVVVILFAAIAVDLGYLFTTRRQLQTAADAAALAGARLLAEGEAESAILVEAKLYSEGYNSSNPGADLWMVLESPETEVGADYVQVTVAKSAPLFFGRILGSDFTDVRAAARAQIAYVAGISGVVPWAAPVIHTERVGIRVDGGPETLLHDKGGNVWSLPVSVMGSTSNRHIIDVIIYNSQTDAETAVLEPPDPGDYPYGVPDRYPGAAAIFVPPADFPIRDVSLSQYVVTAGQGGEPQVPQVTLFVRADDTPSARFNGKNYTLSLVAGETDLWSVSLPVPAVSSLWMALPVDIEVGSGVNKTSVSSAAVLLVRRSTLPLLDVALSDHSPGAGQVIDVSVLVHDYVYGVEYTMRIGGGGNEVGNFAAIDLSTVRHMPYWLHPNHPAEYDITTDPNYTPPAYYCYLEKVFPFEIHLGDTIWTETGVLSGPSTEKALTIRFAGETRTFAQWEADGGGYSSRIVMVPIMEKLQAVAGQSPLRVVAFAAFYVEPYSDLKSNLITGRFIEYVKPSDNITTKYDQFAIKTVRLVPPK